MSESFFDILERRYGDREKFVARTRDRLKDHGISQRQLALRAGYDPGHVSRWMNGKLTPRLETCVTLDEALEQIIRAQQGRAPK